MRSLCFIAAALLMICCDRSMDGSNAAPDQLKGVWLLYEQGFSPGGGYITREVSPNPPQTLSFINERQIVSTIEGMEDYRFYAMERDSADKIIRLTLYKTDPANPPLPENRVQEYRVEQTQNTLKLRNVGCIEGCHLGLKRKTEPTLD
jgi:hypothetical protein